MAIFVVTSLTLVDQCTGSAEFADLDVRSRTFKTHRGALSYVMETWPGAYNASDGTDSTFYVDGEDYDQELGYGHQSIVEIHELDEPG